MTRLSVDTPNRPGRKPTELSPTQKRHLRDVTKSNGAVTDAEARYLDALAEAAKADVSAAEMIDATGRSQASVYGLIRSLKRRGLSDVREVTPGRAVSNLRRAAAKAEATESALFEAMRLAYEADVPLQSIADAAEVTRQTMYSHRDRGFTPT